MAVSSVVFFVFALMIWVTTQWVDRRLIILHMFTSFWACLYLWAMPAWSLTIRGREKIRKNARYVIVSNHQSQLDILVAFRLFFPFKWVSKAEVFKTPFIGWNMELNRYIKLKRGDRDSIHKMMAQCERAISNENSVYFFPEGTRSKDGRLKPFKTGAFILAKKMKVPILPVVINGTQNALPKHSMNFHGKHHFYISVLGEISPETFQDLTPEDTAEMVREQMANALRN